MSGGVEVGWGGRLEEERADHVAHGVLYCMKQGWLGGGRPLNTVHVTSCRNGDHESETGCYLAVLMLN